MSRFLEYLNEKSDRNRGLSLVDIDEVLASTKARIYVVDKDTDEVIHKLSNQEFNTYQLKDNEEFDFREFRDAHLFKTTSDPIQPMIDRVKRMIDMLKKNYRGSWIVFLTARASFDNKNEFLQWFKDQGIDVNFSNLYIERTGDQKTGTVAEKKEKTIMKYLKRYNFKRVRMFDDSIKNLKQFINMTNDIPEDIVESVREEYDIPKDKPAQTWYALHVGDKGKISQYDKKEVY